MSNKAKNKTYLDVELISKHYPTILIGLTLFAFIHLYAYYRFFHVDIVSFISITEILKTIFPSIVILVGFFSLIFSVVLFASLISRNKQIKRNKTAINFLSTELKNAGIRSHLAPQEKFDEIKRGLEEIRKLIPKIDTTDRKEDILPHLKLLGDNHALFGTAAFGLLSFFCFIIVFFINPLETPNIDGVTSKKTDFLTYITSLFVMDFGFLANIFMWGSYRNSDQVKSNPTLKVAWVCVAIFSAVLIMYSSGIVEGLVTLKSPKEISFRTGGRTIHSNDTVIFTGMTDNYIFMFDKRRESSEVFLKSNLDSLILK